MAIQREVQFGLDDFKKPKVLSEIESIVQLFTNILFLRPGDLPSLPHIGINIRQYLYTFKEDFDTEGIKSKIRNNCSELRAYIDFSNMILTITEDSDPNFDSILFIYAPLLGQYSDKSLLIGFRSSKNSTKVVFNYNVTDALI